ncbi:MAG: hypothetical protein HYW95_00590 [Candidatus Wildermuthbacteria bacterium]|nr:hypothetical protein [Candidatus Wildermuthbacteria bacterium]
MPIAFSSTLLTITLTLTLLGIVSRGEHGRNRNLFLFAGVAILFWSFINYLSLQISPYQLYFVRLVLFFAVLLKWVFFLLVYSFAEGQLSLKKPIILFPSILALVAMIATQSPYVFRGLARIDGGIPTPVVGPLIGLFAAAIFSLFIFGGIKLIRELKKAQEVRKKQLMYLGIGYLIMFLLLIPTQFITVAIFQNTSFIQFGPLFTIPFLFLAAYAIFRYRLLDIKVIATEILTALLVAILFLNIFSPENLSQTIFNLFLFIGTATLGYFLVKAVRQEVRQREQLETLTQKLEVANVELKKLDAAKSEFISIASHQLRAPLTAIKGYASMLIEGSYGKISQKAIKVLSNVYDSNERLIKLVNDLLSLSRIESGKITVDLAPANIEQIIESTIGAIQIKAQQKNLQLLFEKPQKPLPQILVDEEKIRNVLINLIDNAIRYTATGSITLKAKQQENERVHIAVADTGDGMTQSEVKTLFQSFSRGTAGMKSWTEGAGLGLYIADQFVRLHNGKIWAESAGKGKGSTFHIELPLNQPQESPRMNT